MEEINKTFLEKIIDYLKANWKKVAIIAVALVVASNFYSCVGSGENSDGLKPDHWYQNDLVQCQNCGIKDSFVRSSGGVFVQYIPVCRSCHEPDGHFSVAIVTQDEQYLKTYTCDCGEKTTIRIKIY